MELKRTEWNKEAYLEFLDFLQTLGDERYREFHLSLIPGADKSAFVGIRMPKLKELAKEISKGSPRAFIKICGGELYEAKILRGLVTGMIKPLSYSDLARLFEEQLGFIDNWALCDSFCSGLKAVKKFREPFFDRLRLLLRDESQWKVRAALVMMLNYYLDEEYIDFVFGEVESVKRKEYYVCMAQAWLLATAAAKQRDKTIEFLKRAELPEEVFALTIKKSCESFRISDNDKALLREMKLRRQEAK